MATASELQEVRPGDLITAADWNALVRQLNGLNDRVTALETGGTTGDGIVITNVLPPGPLRIGTEVHVVGRNFGFTVGACRVFVTHDGTSVRVDAFKLGSNDSELVFNLPDVPGVLSSGLAAKLSVSNQTATAQQDITVLPAQSFLGGDVDVVSLGVEPATIVANQTADFRFRLHPRTNVDATFALTPQVTVSGNQAAWQAALQVLNEDKSPIVGNTVHLVPGQDQIVFVRLTSVPADPPSASFSLSLTASADGITKNSGPGNYTVGQPAEQPDPTIAASFDKAVFDPAGSGTFDQSGTESTVRVRAGGSALIRLLVEFTAVGTYQVSASTPGAAGWDAHILASSTPSSYVITSADLVGSPPKAGRSPEFVITPGSGASATGEVEFKVQRTGFTASRTLRMRLQLAT